MGAEESKQRGEDEDEQQKKKDSSWSSGTAALAVGAAVGTALLGFLFFFPVALLGVAWGVSRYRANTSQRLQPNHRYPEPDSDSEPEYQFESRRVVRGGVWGYRGKTSDIDQRLPNRYAGSDSEPDDEPEPHVRPTITNSFRNLQFSNDKFEAATNTLKILTYNVCCCGEYPISKRMKAIIELVRVHSPYFICFQEITPDIYKTFQRSPWWKDYYCSMSKEEANEKQYFCILLCKINSISIIKEPIIKELIGPPWMVRELCGMETKRGNKSLVVATSHLKSACPDPKIPSSKDHLFKRERLLQAKGALTILKKYPNVMFCGDMNWDEGTDGEFPLPEGWVDAWTELRGEERGYTFDTELNGMLDDHWPLRMRYDRILCNLKGFKLYDIEIIGKDPIPDVFYQGKTKMLPVLPSDHYGLLLTVCTCKKITFRSITWSPSNFLPEIVV